MIFLDFCFMLVVNFVIWVIIDCMSWIDFWLVVDWFILFIMFFKLLMKEVIIGFGLINEIL